MKITTINPITIDGKHVNEPSKYLSADGGDDYYDADGDDYYDADGDDDFYGFDANGKPVKSNKAEVKQFQTFANTKGESLVVDGLWGAKSETAWGKWGTDFAKSIGLGTGTPTLPEPTKEEKITKAKLGQIWDKNKGWITSETSKDVLKSLLAGEGLKGALNTLLGGGSGSATTTTDTTTTTTTEPTKEGLSKNAKIGIAVGIVAILGIVIYVATRPTKTTK